MITPSARLTALEAQYRREALSGLSYHDALARFTALWREARQVHPTFGVDWRADVAADIALARVLNGRPASA